MVVTQMIIIMQIISPSKNNLKQNGILSAATRQQQNKAKASKYIFLLLEL